MPNDRRRDLLIGKIWLQAIVIVGLLGFTLLGILAYRTYTDEPPIPAKVNDPNGRVLFTGEDVTAGQEVFLRNGLMEYGSIFGHGAYLGPDFTADYLHRAALIALDCLSPARIPSPTSRSSTRPPRSFPGGHPSRYTSYYPWGCSVCRE